MDYADLVMLLFAQLSRFLIWALMLLNFIKSATSLTVNPTLKATIRWLKMYIYIGVLIFVAYAVIIILMNELEDRDILDCNSREFMIQNAMALILLIVFIYYAIQVTKSINSIIRTESVVTATSATAISDDEEEDGDEGYGYHEN